MTTPTTTPPRRAGAGGARAAAADVPVVGPREPCPCGSGKRYKTCHGRAARAAATARVLRPYEGLPSEPDWVALHEIVPAATATARLLPGALDAAATGAGDVPREVVVATALPEGLRAARRDDGAVVVALQAASGSGDPSREAAGALLAAAALEPGAVVPAGRPAGAASPGGPRLQDLVDPAEPLRVRVLEAPAADAGAEGPAPADDGSLPTVRLSSVEAAYWAQVGERRHLRWVLPDDEQVLLDALARLHVAGALTVGAGSRYLGAFRAQGLLVPVWDLDPATTADDLEEPVAVLRGRLDEALAATGPLGDAERRARAGVVARQVTLT